MLLNMLLLTLLGTVVAVVAVTGTAVMETVVTAVGTGTAALRLTSPCAVMRRAFSLPFS